MATTQPARPLNGPELEFQPLTLERWNDFEELFGKNGACGGCWCMWMQQTAGEFERNKGSLNKTAMRNRVESNEVPGILAYENGRPVGWCALAPRESYPRLSRSRVLKPVDDRPVWSVVCFFVEKRHRKRGVTVQLLGAALEYARSRGANVLEGYPTDPKEGPMPAVFAWSGLYSAFRSLGFKEVARRSETRPIMRYFFNN